MAPRTILMPLLLALLVFIFCQAGAAHAASSLDEWRSEASRARTLAENDAPRAYEDAKRLQATNRMIEMVTSSWIAVPIIEGMGYWAVNPKRVGQFKPIPGRHEFGDVAERMPRPEQKPW